MPHTDVSWRMQLGNTPLHLAANTGQLEIVKDLLEAMGKDQAMYLKMTNKVSVSRLKQKMNVSGMNLHDAAHGACFT